MPGGKVASYCTSSLRDALGILLNWLCNMHLHGDKWRILYPVFMQCAGSLSGVYETIKMISSERWARARAEMAFIQHHAGWHPGKDAPPGPLFLNHDSAWFLTGNAVYWWEIFVLNGYCCMNCSHRQKKNASTLLWNERRESWSKAENLHFFVSHSPHHLTVLLWCAGRLLKPPHCQIFILVPQ